MNRIVYTATRLALIALLVLVLLAWAGPLLFTGGANETSHCVQFPPPADCFLGLGG